MTTWRELPEQVREAVRNRIGPVTTVAAVTSGQNSDVSTVLHRSNAPSVFLKGVNGVSRRMRWLRNETIAAPLTRGLAPAVLFSLDVAGWLVVGFEYVTGRPVSFAPDSTDLPIVATAVDRISALPAPGLRPLRDRWHVTNWWDKLAEHAPDMVTGWDLATVSRWAPMLPELADGDRLVHTDLHGDQFLISADGTTHVIDWGYPARGAGWVDAAFLFLRLVEAGHRPDEAEEWVRANLGSFSTVDHECLTAFAVYIAGMWGYWAATEDIPGAEGRAKVARECAAWCLAKYT